MEDKRSHKECSLSYCGNGEFRIPDGFSVTFPTDLRRVGKIMGGKYSKDTHAAYSYLMVTYGGQDPAKKGNRLEGDIRICGFHVAQWDLDDNLSKLSALDRLKKILVPKNKVS